MGHSCRTLLWGTLIGHSCGTLLRDTLVRHSCGTRLRGTLVEHSFGTLLWDTRVATRSAHTLEAVTRAFRTRLPPKVTRQVSKTERFVRDLLQKSHVKSPKRAFSTRLPPKVTRQVSKTSVSYETSSKSHTSSLQNERFVRDFPKSHASSLKNDRFVRDFLQKSHVESPKRAFRTRPPPKVTLRGCKTSVSYETSSKSHASSLKNERFVRDLLQKSHVKSPKRALRTRLP